MKMWISGRYLSADVINDISSFFKVLVISEHAPSAFTVCTVTLRGPTTGETLLLRLVARRGEKNRT